MTAAASLDALPSAPTVVRLESPTSRELPIAARPTRPAALALRRLVVDLPRGPLTILDWNVEAGSKVALIGRNGVGKTSVTEALLGLRDGSIVDGSLLGIDIAQWRRRPALRKRLGVQLQRVAYPGRPRVRELVAMHRSLYDRTSEVVMEALGIAPLSNSLYEFLSRGETQRVDLFLALAHEPELLFLDEPFTGLDPRFARNLAAVIARMADTTILMCCHTSEELGLVDSIAWLADSGLARCGAPDAMRRDLVGDYRLAVQCDDEFLAQALARELRSTTPDGSAVHVDADRVGVSGRAPFSDTARLLADRPGVLAVEAGRSSLSDLLRHCSREA